MVTNSKLQWSSTTAEEARRYDDIWLIDSSTVWAVNSNGHILKGCGSFQVMS